MLQEVVKTPKTKQKDLQIQGVLQLPALLQLMNYFSVPCLLHTNGSLLQPTNASVQISVLLWG